MELIFLLLGGALIVGQMAGLLPGHRWRSRLKDELAESQRKNAELKALGIQMRKHGF